MKKTALTVSMLLLLNILIIFAPQVTGEKKVEASNAGVIYAPNYHVNYLDLPGEEQVTRDVCTYIMNFFVTYGYNYGWLYKCVDSAATRSQYGSSALNAENNYNAATVFTKGHAANYKCNQNGPIHHFLMDNVGAWVQDAYIWTKTPYGKHRFVCTWHCGTTMDYPGQYCTYCAGRTSFPYTWTHSNTLNLEAYFSTSGNYVFIGHEGYSPQFLTSTGWGSYNYAHFVYYLYQYLVQYHCSVKTSASWASYYTQGNYYLPSTPLYTLRWIDPPDPPSPNPPLPGMNSRMHIYGNGNLGVPGY